MVRWKKVQSIFLNQVIFDSMTCNKLNEYIRVVIKIEQGIISTIDTKVVQKQTAENRFNNEVKKGIYRLYNPEKGIIVQGQDKRNSIEVQDPRFFMLKATNQNMRVILDEVGRRFELGLKEPIVLEVLENFNVYTDELIELLNRKPIDTLTHKYGVVVYYKNSHRYFVFVVSSRTYKGAAEKVLKDIRLEYNNIIQISNYFSHLEYIWEYQHNASDMPSPNMIVIYKFRDSINKQIFAYPVETYVVH